MYFNCYKHNALGKIYYLDVNVIVFFSKGIIVVNCSIKITVASGDFTHKKNCGGAIIKSGVGPDAHIFCKDCGAEWSLDSKDGVHEDYPN